MARTKGALGAKTKAKLAVVGGANPPPQQITAGIGHNSGALTDKEEKALHLNQVREYKILLKSLSDVQAAIRNFGKRVKSEGGSVADLKRTIKLETPGGEAEIKASIEKDMKLLRWAGVAVGTQTDMFVDIRSQFEKGHEEGERDGMNGYPARTIFSPGTEGYKGYMEGYHAGQMVNVSAIKKTKKADDAPPETHVRSVPKTDEAKPDEFDNVDGTEDGDGDDDEQHADGEDGEQDLDETLHTVPDESVEPPAAEVPAEEARADKQEGAGPGEEKPWSDDAQIAERKGEEI